MSDENKKLTKAAEAALSEADAHAQGGTSGAIPPAEQGGHAHSHAAHLGTDAQADTKPADDLRGGYEPDALRQPPSVFERSGKQHR